MEGKLRMSNPPKGGGGGRSPGEGEYKELFAFSTLKMVENDDLF